MTKGMTLMELLIALMLASSGFMLSQRHLWQVLQQQQQLMLQLRQQADAPSKRSDLGMNGILSSALFSRVELPIDRLQLQSSVVSTSRSGPTSADLPNVLAAHASFHSELNRTLSASQRLRQTQRHRSKLIGSEGRLACRASGQASARVYPSC